MVGAPTAPPGGRTYAIGAPTHSLKDCHGGTKHDILSDVNVVSDLRDFVPAQQDQVLHAEVAVDLGGQPIGAPAVDPTSGAPAVPYLKPGGSCPNSKCRHKSYGGCARGHNRSRGRCRVCISDPRRYRANRGRFRSFIKKFNNIKKFSEARDLLRLLVMGPVSPI